MNNIKLFNGWYNYRTEEYDYLPDAPTDFTDYIPQHPSALGLYRVYIEMGDTALESARKVLLACLSDGNLTPPPDAATI